MVRHGDSSPVVQDMPSFTRLSSIMAHLNSSSTWQDKAQSKRESVLSLIPPEWRIPGPVPSVEEQVDISGPYIEQFLSAREVELTTTDAVKIVERTSTGQWTAEEVARAFAHRAALAHQLVSRSVNPLSAELNRPRPGQLSA